MNDRTPAHPPRQPRRERNPALRRIADRAFHGTCVAIAGVAILVLVILLAAIFVKGIGHFRVADDAGEWHFSWSKVGRFVNAFASSDPAAAGIKAPLAGSVIVCLLCMLFAVPIGVGTAILLEEFKPRRSRTLMFLHGLVQTNITNLAGVPSIVYGILGVTVFATFFGLFPRGSSLEIGASYFDQYTLPDGRVVFTQVAGPAPQGAGQLVSACIDEIHACRQTGHPDAIALATTAEQELLGHLRLSAALAAGTEPAAAAARASTTDALTRLRALDDAIPVYTTIERNLTRSAARIHDRLDVERNETKRAQIEAGEAAILALRNALLDDLKSSHATAFGAHPARRYLVPRRIKEGDRDMADTSWLGGDIGYEKADVADVHFISSVEKAAQDTFEANLLSGLERLRQSIDNQRSGSRKTGPVAMTPDDARRIATGLATVLPLPPAANATLVSQLTALDGQKGSDMRAAREKIAADLGMALRPPVADAARMSVGAPGLRIQRTLWWHVGFPFGRGIMAGALTLMLVVLPIVIVASQEAMRSVPQILRQAALGLGATPWQTVARCTVPAAVPGICTGVILALSRAIGEAAPILILGGVVFITFLPGNLMSDFTVMPLQIFDWTGQPAEEFRELAAAGIIVLLAVLIVFNGTAAIVRQRTAKTS